MCMKQNNKNTIPDNPPICNTKSREIAHKLLIMYNPPHRIPIEKLHLESTRFLWYNQKKMRG